MKTQSILVGMIGLLSISIMPVFAQSSRLAVGVDYGMSMIQASPSSLSRFILFPSGVMTPNNLRGHIDFNASSSFVLRFSMGYGATKENTEYTGTLQSNGVDGSEQLHRKTNVKVSGFPVEGAMLFQLPLDNEQRVGVHFGLGGGYYSYTFKGEFISETKGSSIPSENYSTRFEFPEMTISGPAQFFLLGFDLRLNSRLRGTLELSKLGLSGLKQKQEEKYESNSYESKTQRNDKYNAANGLNDVAFSFGVSLQLGK